MPPLIETPPDSEVPLQRRVELELLGALGTVEGQLLLVLLGLVVIHGLAGRLLYAAQLAPGKD